jgi:hypothetical protein
MRLRKRGSVERSRFGQPERWEGTFTMVPLANELAALEYGMSDTEELEEALNRS